MNVYLSYEPFTKNTHSEIPLKKLATTHILQILLLVQF